MERPRILIVGGGFAGLECARRLERKLSPSEAEITLVTPFSYQLYLPLLPHVAAGVLTPQSVAVSLRRSLRRTHIVPGGAIGVDPASRVCVVRKVTDEVIAQKYDILVLAPGSVTRTFDIPGLTDYARGMKTLAEAAYVRDHVIAQLDLASATLDQRERESRLQFVVVGGGYAGTETAACLQRLTTAAARRYPRLDAGQIKWHLIDIAPKLMPELGDPLGAAALEVLRERGIEVSLGVSVAEVGAETVKFTDGRVLPCRTLIWTAGVAASPLIGTLDAETVRGRLAVTAEMRVPQFEGVFALGDAAAVPDLAKGDGAVCPPTAQHSARQGRAVADNVIASLHNQPLEPYYHKDLGLVVDLGGKDAVSKPIGVELRGVPAQLVARGYHLMAMRTNVAKLRVGANWLMNATAGDDFVRIGFLARQPARLQDFEYTDAYLSRDQVRAHAQSLLAKG
ncbi:NAD(P)/FAD-dependent oxidoreductase [Kitasatospora aureofaciens]|uniref:NADH dehydrogenase n=1 Tax=Kitasatospora aureofaciens TaxID=1894 RepID=A0A1E7NCS4_KITAU|nr:NAD(P)/FAD-dependent oxidoreductase [Kitasatospora aureofaciens]QEU98637.1 NAD(P)/FAD-dependent oxidoreductase [Streptomyces viridifaciens]ARF82102.1 NADH-quinone oxidoreductase subunit E [Kitasatospora aureofaciens]OEV38500.1 NADH dehydrogenase [Kitasatospora aureofaciens]UKZ04604.1 NAD(P)/FAD-dependent oxidoreductase [Streptomyces viridifaciens]GGU84555.1 oxidoreductase [Kitasatospora aureofaciens]